jgi:Cof subfamily protein (haloacid dehalogenase superfamily)
MIKLIASDMDGTLLDENGCIPEEFFDIYETLNSKDIVFVAASGRQYYTLERDLDSIKDNVIFIAENGSFVMHENKELYSCHIDKITVQDLIQVGRRVEGTKTVLCGKKGAYVESSDPKFIEQVSRYFAKYEIVDDLMDVKDDILKLSICDFKGPAENANNVYYPLFKDKLRVVVSSELWLDIFSLKANKGEALKYIQDKLNISSMETMAFGDYFNDVEMLQNAHHSYAMNNAPEGVKKHARYIAKSNKEHGVLDTIKKIVLKKASA